jgi:hypothetical protein
MPTLTAEVKGPEWPSILDGERCDRGWEHFFKMEFPWTPAIGDNVELRFVVPARETWLVEHLNWAWSPQPGWASAEILRHLTSGQYKEFGVGTDWTPWVPGLGRRRTLYTIPGTDEDLGNVNRSQLVTDLSGLRADARWGFNWIGAIAGGATALFLEMLVVRIPLAKQRYWTKKDMANALTQIEGLGRRVS